jgi:pimeloyl-ACP methyl ester carboxylesterase
MQDVSVQTIQTNGMTMRIAEAGTGPLVLLIHGWPESWYSWRHQLVGLAKAGYHAVAPDMRGYGDTDAPADASEYRIDKLAGDVVGVIDALGEQQAAIVGHDWGAIVVWDTAILYPQRISGVIGMSVPYGTLLDTPPLESWKETMGDNFFYVLYHNEPGGVAEAEYDRDPRGFLSMLYTSPDTPLHEPTITDPKRSAGGWIGRMGAPKERPDWLSAEDLDYYVGEFSRAGFRGGVNYYRNFDTNWSFMKDYDPVIKVPSAFVSGAADGVIGGADKAGLTASMEPMMQNFRGVTLIPGAGHWVQQEAPEDTNAALIAYLKSFGTGH